MRRAELSMTVIIGAAIALLILVIISVLVLNAAGGLQRGVGCYGVENAICITEGESCSDYNDGTQTFVLSTRSCPADEQRCCVPFGRE